MYRIVITDLAKHDIQSAYDWWAEVLSTEQANQWYAGIHTAIQSLKQMPARCAMASESNILHREIRQLLYGSGRKKTHRILFGIEESVVVIFRILHTARDELTADDLD